MWDEIIVRSLDIISIRFSIWEVALTRHQPSNLGHRVKENLTASVQIVICLEYRQGRVILSHSARYACVYLIRAAIISEIYLPSTHKSAHLFDKRFDSARYEYHGAPTGARNSSLGHPNMAEASLGKNFPKVLPSLLHVFNGWYLRGLVIWCVSLSRPQNVWG